MVYVWYALIVVVLVAALVGFSYLFPSFAVNLLKIYTIDLWQLLKPAVLKRMTPAEEAAWHEFEREGATQKDIEAWNRKRILRRKSPNIPPPEPPKDSLY